MREKGRKEERKKERGNLLLLINLTLIKVKDAGIQISMENVDRVPQKNNGGARKWEELINLVLAESSAYWQIEVSRAFWLTVEIGTL